MKLVQVIIISLSLSLVGFSASQAQSAPSPKVIANHCQAAQSYVSGTLKSNDLRARVDRLQTYQYIHQRLELLVQRLEHNNQSGASALADHLDEFASKVEEFKLSYETYDKSREDLSEQSDCSKNTTEFSGHLTRMRLNRQRLTKKVNELDKMLTLQTSGQLRELYNGLVLKNDSAETGQ